MQMNCFKFLRNFAVSSCSVQEAVFAPLCLFQGFSSLFFLEVYKLRTNLLKCPFLWASKSLIYLPRGLFQGKIMFDAETL